MRKGESAGEHVDRRIVDRKLLETPRAKVGSRHFFTRDREHGFGRVDADDAVTQPGKLGCMAAGTAGSVERIARTHRREHAMHDRLLALDRGIRTVVARRPSCVTLFHVVFGHRDAQRVWKLVERGDDRSHLVHSGQRGRRRVEAGANRGESLDGKKVFAHDEGVDALGHPREARDSPSTMLAIFVACKDARMTTERLEVERKIAADPAAIFRVLSDPHGHVTIDSSGMLMDATGDPVRAAGDTFVVHMDREALNDYPMGHYDVTVHITTFVPDREIAWTIVGVIEPPIGHVYGYRLTPVDGGTLVASYYDWSNIDPTWRDANIFPVISEGALRATLGILARTVARARRGGSA